MRKVTLVALTNIVALFAVAYLLPGIWFSSPVTLIWAGIILGLVNLLIRPVLMLLTLPLNFVTLGLFTLVVNAWMVMLTGVLVPGLRVHGFGTAFLTSLVVSLFNWLVKDTFRKPNGRS